MYAGCVSGAIQKKEYLAIIEESGFEDIKVQKEKKITIPDEILSQYLSEEAVSTVQKDTGIYSITVYGKKPAKDDRNCCEPGSGCC